MDDYIQSVEQKRKQYGRLSIIHHGAYCLLLAAVKEYEAVPVLDDALDWTWALTDEEYAAVTDVFNTFFAPEPKAPLSHTEGLVEL